jgi:hypothetical protein
MSSSRVLFVPRGAPWHLASFDHFFEYLPIFQRIHGPPEALVFVSEELAIFDQAIEGIENQFLAVQADGANRIPPDPLAHHAVAF